MHEAKSTYKVTWVIGPTYRDELNMEFTSPTEVVRHIRAAYPDHTQYEIIVTNDQVLRRNK